MSGSQLLWRRANKATLDTLRGNSGGQYDIRLGRKPQIGEFFDGLPQVKDHDGLRTDVWTEPSPLPDGTGDSAPWKLEVRRMSEASKRRDMYIRSQRPETAHPLWRPGTGPTNRTRPEQEYAVLLRTPADRFHAGWLRRAQVRALPQALRERLEQSDGLGATPLDEDETTAILAALGQETAEEERGASPEDGLPPEEEVTPPPPLDPGEAEEVSAQEGQPKSGQHTRRERSPWLRRKRIAQAGERPTCEACGFDFEGVYGERGRGFIECHHKVSLAEIDPATPTRLEDLALLCANCHRMIHRRRPWLAVEDLEELLSREAGAK